MNSNIDADGARRWLHQICLNGGLTHINATDLIDVATKPNVMPESPLDNAASGMTRKEYQIQRMIGGEWRTIYTGYKEGLAVDVFKLEMKLSGKRRFLELTIGTKVRGLKLE